jgi:hypothetical protein
MKKFHHYTLAISIFSLFSTAQGTESTQVFMDDDQLNYIGDISTDANEKIFKLFSAQTKKPAVLNIRSKGGDTMAGMELGRWMHSQGLAIKVLEYCFSSCANYVFPAAHRKIVSNFAIIGYHGGLSSKHFGIDAKQEVLFATIPAEQREAVRKKFQEEVISSLASQIKSEERFFADMGVQRRITTLGQSAYYEKRYEQTDAIGWSFSVEDFAKLGVKNITVINPPWRPRLLSSTKFVFLVKVRQ